MIKCVDFISTEVGFKTIHHILSHVNLFISYKIMSALNALLYLINCTLLFILFMPGRPTILNTVGQGLIALAVGAGGGGLDIFTFIYLFSFFSLSLGDGLI